MGRLYPLKAEPLLLCEALSMAIELKQRFLRKGLREKLRVDSFGEFKKQAQGYREHLCPQLPGPVEDQQPRECYRMGNMFLIRCKRVQCLGMSPYIFLQTFS